MLEIKNLNVCYGRVTAIDGLSLHVKKGSITALIGANGAGKSTLLSSVFNQPKPQQGQVLFCDSDITDLPAHKIGGLGISIVPEGRRIFPKMTVLENILLGATCLPQPDGQILDYVLSLFPRLKERLAQRGGTLSGGEQQMLAIARALMSKPRLLLLDEPSLGLAPLIIKQIFSVIASLRRDMGMTIFLVEQNAHQALQLADYGYVLANGRLVLQGTGKDLLADEGVRQAYLAG